MSQGTFSQKRALIVREILDNYHIDSGIGITGDRYFVYNCSKQLARLHHEFGCLALAYVPPEKEEEYMRELKRIRRALKIEYLKLKVRSFLQ